jgi:hypothetical protein
VVVRLNESNDAVVEYLLLPQTRIRPWRTHFGGRALAGLQRHRFDSFDQLVAAVMALRSRRPMRRAVSRGAWVGLGG